MSLSGILNFFFFFSFLQTHAPTFQFRSESNGTVKSTAVLGRFQKDVRLVSSYLARRGIPFYESTEVPTLFFPGVSHFFRLLFQPKHDVVFENALDHFMFSNTRDSDVTSELIKPIKLLAVAHGISYADAALHRSIPETLPPNHYLSLQAFIESYSKALALYRQHKTNPQRTLSQLVSEILRVAYPTPWNPNMKRVVDEVSRASGSHSSLEEFVTSLAAGKGMLSSSRKNPLSLMTMHAAKGLEFDEVILPFWVDGNVPIEDSPSERRLAFVSLTRAREKVIITFSQMALKVSETQRERCEAEPSL